ncbi:MAG: hypothetical protein ABF264_00095 [Flavobacteriales bacterium]
MNTNLKRTGLFLKLIVLSVILFKSDISFSQNVGVGTTNPTNTFHIVRSISNPALDPLRVEGVRNSTNDTSFLVIDSQGVVKYLTLSQLKGSVAVNFDSIAIANLITYGDTLFSSVSFTNDLKTFIYNNGDTLFANQQWLDSLSVLIGDSIDTDVDSLVLVGDSLHLYENGKQVSVRLTDMDSTNEAIDSIVMMGDSLAIFEGSTVYYINMKNVVDSLQSVTSVTYNDSTIIFINERGDTNFIDIKSMIDSNETVTTIRNNNDGSFTYFNELGDSVTINMLDSGFINYDSIIISTLLTKGDTIFSNSNFIDSLKSFIYNNGDTLFSNVNFTDNLRSFIYNNGDTLLNNQAWLDSLISLIADSIETVTTIRNNNDGSFTYFNELGDSVTINMLDSGFINYDSIVISTLLTKGDTIFSNSNFIDSLKTFIYNNGDTLFSNANFTDSLRSFIYNNGDTLLNNQAWLDSLISLIADSIETVTTLVDNNDGSFTYVNEDGDSVTISLSNGTGGSIDTIYNSNDTLFVVEGDDTTFVRMNYVDSAEWLDKGDYILARRADERGNKVVITDEGRMGMNTTTPSTQIEVVPSAGIEPIKLDSLRQGGVNDTSIVVVDPATGVLRHMNINDLKVKYAEIYADGTESSLGANGEVILTEGDVTSSLFTITDSTITVATDGKYKITYRVGIVLTSNSAAIIDANLMNNSVDIPGTKTHVFIQNTVNKWGTLNAVKIVDLYANDEIKLRVSSPTAGASYRTAPDGSSLLIEKL